MELSRGQKSPLAHHTKTGNCWKLHMGIEPRTFWSNQNQRYEVGQFHDRVTHGFSFTGANIPQLMFILRNALMSMLLPVMRNPRFIL